MRAVQALMMMVLADVGWEGGGREAACVSCQRVRVKIESLADETDRRAQMAILNAAISICVEGCTVCFAGWHRAVEVGWLCHGPSVRSFARCFASC